MPAFGGLRGARARRDGLVPGSPEAIARDREKERLRKQRQRARERAANPPPLPSAPVGATDAGQPADGLGEGPEEGADLGGLPGDESGAGFVPWEAATLAPLLNQLLPTVEAATVASLTRKASAARLPGDFLRELETDCRWPGPAKKALELAGPQLAAKWLNRSGVSAENQLEVACLAAVGAIVANHSTIAAKLEKIIAAHAAGEKGAKP